jgi:hypothetical protein
MLDCEYKSMRDHCATVLRAIEVLVSSSATLTREFFICCHAGVDVVNNMKSAWIIDIEQVRVHFKYSNYTIHERNRLHATVLWCATFTLPPAMYTKSVHILLKH